MAGASYAAVMMTWAMVLQGVLFAAAVWGWVKVLRAIPRYRASRTPRVWGVWGVLGGAALAVGVPLGIAYLGHGSLRLGRSPLTAATVWLLTAGIGLLVVGWRAGLPRGKGRCPRCWYEMTGIQVGDGAQCPECGREVRTERELRRVRGSAWLVLMGVMLMGMSYVTLKVEEMGEHGWKALAPATGMIVGLPWTPEGLLIEGDGSLWRREANGRLWGWQVELLGWRASGVIRGSANPERLERVAPFVPSGTVRLSERAMVVLGQEMEKGEKEAARVMLLGALFPESLSLVPQRGISSSERLR